MEPLRSSASVSMVRSSLSNSSNAFSKPSMSRMHSENGGSTHQINVVTGSDRKEESIGSREQKRNRKRPNYFLSLQLSHSDAVLEAMRLVQVSLLEHNPSLKHVCESPAKAHITLGVMNLESSEQVKNAVITLQSLKENPEFCRSPISLTLKGLATFRNEVLYLQVEDHGQGKGIEQLQPVLRSSFIAAGLMEECSKPFTPHLTVAKMSRVPPHRRKKIVGMHKFPDEAYQEHIDTMVRDIIVQEIQLCSMDKPLSENGYYHIESSISLVDSGVLIDAGEK